MKSSRTISATLYLFSGIWWLIMANSYLDQEKFLLAFIFLVVGPGFLFLAVDSITRKDD